MALTRQALAFLNSGAIRISTVKNNIMAEIGLDTSIERSPCDIISDWRSARSMLSPSTKPK